MRVDIGNRYLTPTGLPVRVADIEAGETMVLQSLVSDNRIAVPPGYPLSGYREPAFETRACAYSRQPKRAGIMSRPPKLLAPIIDALLLAGNKTMRGIVREVKRRASAQCRGKDVWANVRARIYWLRKKGFRVEKNERNQLSLKRTAEKRLVVIAPTSSLSE